MGRHSEAARDIVISSINRTFATTPPLAGHPSIEGNCHGASRGKGKNRRLGFIPLYGGVARSAGVVRAARHAEVVICLIYCWNSYIKSKCRELFKTDYAIPFQKRAY
jgi:hypothetical protein